MTGVNSTSTVFSLALDTPHHTTSHTRAPRSAQQHRQPQLLPRWVSCETASRVYNCRQGTFNAWRPTSAAPKKKKEKKRGGRRSPHTHISPKSKSADRSMSHVPQRCYSWFALTQTRTHANSYSPHCISATLQARTLAHRSVSHTGLPSAAGRKVDYDP